MAESDARHHSNILGKCRGRGASAWDKSFRAALDWGTPYLSPSQDTRILVSATCVPQMYSQGRPHRHGTQ